MTNWRPDDPRMYEDVQTRWQYENAAKNKPEDVRLHRLWRSSRDSARTPMQWSAETNAGFTSGKPWFYVNENYKEINVAQQEADPDSLLNFYRRAIALRKSLPVVRDGDYRELLHHSKRLYAYTREDGTDKLLVVCSFSEKPISLPRRLRPENAELLLCSYAAEDAQPELLRPYEARVYRCKK